MRTHARSHALNNERTLGKPQESSDRDVWRSASNGDDELTRARLDDRDPRRRGGTLIDGKWREHGRRGWMQCDAVVSERVRAVLEPECEVALGVATFYRAMHVTLVGEGRAVALVHVRRERVVQREVEVRYDLHAAQPQDGADER